MKTQKDKTHIVSIYFFNVEKARDKKILKMTASMVTDIVVFSDNKMCDNVYFSIEPPVYEIRFRCNLKYKYEKYLLWCIEEVLKLLAENDKNIEISIEISDINSKYISSRQII